MNSNIILESGKEYGLSQLFSGDKKIVIPDLQRDYCWGDKAWNKEKNNYTELVSDFTKNLLSSYNDKPKDDLTLGLIYGYENPKHHIQLSDGQQRITTLFLLLGMLNRRVKNKFQKHLISDHELKEDDKELYLLYAIRESTLYFLGDLVNNFFLKNDIQKVEDIIKQDWYFKEYDLDSSIQSMISALKTIDNLLEEPEENLCHEGFGKFILEKLKMIYYDMGNRTRGEETFVIINTTGEPLTATENLKPILIGNIEGENERETASNEWEEREEWFWQNRTREESTSDNAMNDFFIWYWQIRLLQNKSWKNKKEYTLNPRELFLNKPKTHQENEENPQVERWVESIKTETINRYFKALENLIKLSKTEKNKKVLRSIQDEEISLNWFRKTDLDVVLPLIAYIEKFKEPKYFYEFLRRIRKNVFDNKWEERKSNHIDWRYIIQIIEDLINEEDVLKYKTNSAESKIKKIPNIDLHEWYNDEEKLKDELKVSNKDKIEEWEDHEDFMGDLTFLFSINDNVNDLNKNEQLENLKKYYDNYTKTIDLVKQEKKENYVTSNLFRLYYLFIGINKTGKIYRTSKMEGVLFSTINRNHLQNNEFKSLCKSDDIKEYIEKYVKEKIKEWHLFDISENNFTVDKFIKAWLTLKVFNANQNESCLEYCDGNNTGVAAYNDVYYDKLSFESPFYLANSICGFAVKSGGGGGNYIHYTNKDLWLAPNIIDTPFAGIKYQKFENNFEDRKVTQSEIEKNEKKINEIIEYIES